MNKEEYIASFNLEINDNIARLVSKMDDTISEVWKIDKKDILEALNFKENLIKYIENKIRECNNKVKTLGKTEGYKIPVLSARIYSYRDVLERIKSNNYES